MQRHAIASPRLRAAAWTPWLLALAFWLLVACTAAFTLWQLRRDAIEGQTRELGLVSLAITGEIDRGLRGVEEGVRAVQAELGAGRLPTAGAAATQALRTSASLMPLVSRLWLLDAQGHVAAASDATQAPALSSFWPPLDARAADTVALSRPMAGSGASPSDTQVALALPYTAPHAPGGWVVAAVPASHLLGAFGTTAPSPDTRMAVFRGDGARLASANVPATAVDEALVRQRLTNRTGMEVRTLRDGRKRLTGLHSVQRYGIEVVVARDLDALLADWRATADAAAVALALLFVILAVAVHYAQLAGRRRNEVQAAMQAQASRASRLEALGTLAGGVAHDFNNVLAAIVGYAEMARDAAPEGGDQARHLDRTLRAALRGKALVQRIITFSRGGARTSAVFDVEPVVEEVLGLLAASLRPGVVLERLLEAPGARLRGDPTQAFEAVMNLCTNALQAMPDGGMLTVGVARAHEREPRMLSHSALAPGRYVAVSVVDQGGGITPDVAEHLFEPFFTTRAAQSGTGLGLAVVHGVAAEFGGAIDVQSTPGRGARFCLYLPECTEPAEAGGEIPSLDAVGAGQRLLVVDDEPELVALAEEMLKGLGYDPIGYTDSAAALHALRREPRAWAAVITDEVMPRLTGTQLAQSVHEVRHDLPVLLVSGYGGVSLAERAAVAGVTRVLAKPLQRTELARALAQALRGK
jgi:signal transduction histidine kinase/ActR/RegA family two-component response regulator